MLFLICDNKKIKKSSKLNLFVIKNKITNSNYSVIINTALSMILKCHDESFFKFKFREQKKIGIKIDKDRDKKQHLIS